MTDQQKQLADALLRELSDRGQIIEGGWRAFELLSGMTDPKFSEIQRAEMRKAYFFGAQHLWASVMGILEPGEEPTELDLERMTKINAELEKFVEEMKGTGK